MEKSLLESKKITDELAKGLTETEKVKFSELTEEIEPEDPEAFRKSATLIRESYFKETAPKNAISSPVTDSPVTVLTEETVDPEMRGYIEAARFFNN